MTKHATASFDLKEKSVNKRTPLSCGTNTDNLHAHQMLDLISCKLVMKQGNNQLQGHV